MTENRFTKFQGNIIWSADGMTDTALLEVVNDASFPRDKVAIKLDRLFLIKYGLGMIGKVQDAGVPVFADAKIVEIPSKVMEITKLYLEQQPWMLNVMGAIASTGITPDMIEERKPSEDDFDALYRFAQLCKDAGTKPCAVTVLTSKSPETVKHEYGTISDTAVSRYVQLALKCGVMDIVCSPLEAKFLRGQARCDGLWLNTPGVRLGGSSRDDQRRTMTPGEAIANGADRLVIGRDLSRNGKFSENLQKILADIESWKAKAEKR